jgi:nicotinamidase-related amidase
LATKKTALVVVDMLNTYEHADADTLIRSVREVLPNIASLIERARDAGVEIIYVNDNYGEWSKGRSELVERASAGPHGDLIEPIVPGDDTAFVVKARHSAFFETPLEYLLRQGGMERIVLVGQVTEQCILYSALDAYIRHIDVVVPPDAVASIHAELHDAALEMMRINMDADLTPSADVRLS